ncbi:MAG TPA: hypothetical protein VHB46_19585 [Burkholderiales bacterium]|nr:hypothetical protein [Burkholderiales bacterium]
MKSAVAIGVACILLAGCEMTERTPAAADHAAAEHIATDHIAQWAVDPATPGSDAPAAGRALFDYIMLDPARTKADSATESAYDLPPVFDDLVARIEQRLGCRESCSQRVLIPLGRSLQRTAAWPGFFSSPRVVVAFTGEGDGSVAARDRLYLGFQRRAGTIEVISYNETLGRFEFQLVTGYTPGGKPRVVYAKRRVCVACHQNHGPIFSRQVWDETNANPRIAALLNEANPAFERVAVEVPNAIDDATERANLIGVIQRLWVEACDAGCRRAALVAALQYRLSGERGFEREPVSRSIAAGLRRQFPNGIAVPNPDIPNRDPLAFPEGTTGRAQSHVAGPLEALVPRAPIDTWRADDAELAHRFVTGIAGLLSEADMRKVDERLVAVSPTPRVYHAACTIVAGDASLPFGCSGEVTLHGNASSLAELAVGDAMPLRNLAAGNVVRKRGRLEFTPESEGRRVRLANGNAVSKVALQWDGDKGEVEVSVAEDFSPLREHLSAATLAGGPLRRASVMAAVDAALDLPPATRCCDDTSALPAAQTEVAGSNLLPPEAVAFQQPCGGCHATTQTSPPNFLAGDAKRVSTLLAHCAPRIYVRMAMWDAEAGQRLKVPMPPPQASRAGHPWIQESPPEFVAPLRNTVAGWLRAETGRDPDLADLLMHGYENLRSCLPAGA